MRPGADIQALIDAVPPPADLRLSVRTPITVEPGEYEITTALVVGRCVSLDMRGVTLYPAAGVDAIRFESGAAWSTMRGAFVVGPVASHTGIGIDVQAHAVQVIDVFVREMHTGIRLWGTAANGTNANACTVARATVFNCTEVGVHLRGGDCNAGVFDAIEIIGANARTRIGILDESFLGNLMRGVHVSSTREHAVKVTAPANYGTWEGVYLENDCGSELPAGEPAIQSQPYATWLGGNAIAHVRLGDRFGLGMSKAKFSDTAPNGDTLSVTLPHAADHSYLGLQHTAAPGSGRPSGGVEGLIRRETSRKTIELQTRAAGVRRPVLAATRADAVEGHGVCVASPKTAATDLPPLRIVSALPATVTVGAHVLLSTVNGARLYLGESTQAGNVWTPVPWV